MTVFSRMAFAVAVLIAAASAASAQSIWIGETDVNWSTASNWNPAAPSSGGSVVYNNLSTGNLATGFNDITGLSLSSITVGTVPGAVTIGGNAITLTAATSINMSAASANLTINAPLVLGTSTLFQLSTGRTLTLGGGISGAQAANLTFNGGNNNAIFVITAPITYSGQTIVGQGTLQPGPGMNNVFSPSSVINIGGTGQSVVALNGTNQTIAGLTQNGTNTRRIQGGSATLSNLTINVADGLIFSFTSTIGQSGIANSNNFAIVKTGPGLQEFANTTGNYFITAPTTIQTGALGFLAANGGPTSDLVLDGGVFQNQGTTAVTFNRTLSATAGGNNFRWTANGGGFSARNAVHIININGNGSALNWGTDVGTEIVGPLKFGHQSATAQTLFQNPINLNGTVRIIDVADNTTFITDKATLAGAIANGTGSGSIEKTGTGVLELTGINTYTGTTTITGGVLSVVSPTALPGYDQQNKIFVQPTATIQVLIGAGGFSNTDFNTLLANTTFNGNSLLGIANNTGDSYSFTMALPSPTMGLRKDGSGEILIPGANTFSGGAVFAGGTVQIGDNGSFGTGSLTLGGVTLSSTSNRVISNPSVFINGAVTFGTSTNTGTFNFTTKVDFSGALRNLTFDTDVVLADGFINGTITKIGLGTLTLRGSSDSGARDNNFTRGTTTLDSNATYTTQNGFRIYSAFDGETTTVNLATGSSLNITTTLTSSIRVGFTGGGAGPNRNVVVNFAGNVTLPVGGTGSGGSVIFDNEGASNTANLLAGGLVSLVRVSKDTGGTPSVPNVTTFNFDGGTLRALQNEGNFIGGIDFANVQAGGGTIDTNIFNVVLTMPLSAGSPSGGITKIGQGTLTYSATPSTYTGVTRINSGTLVLPSANNLPGGNALTLGGGRLRSQDAGNIGQGQSFGELRLITATSSGIDLGNAIYQIDFSTLVAEPDAVLSVTGWQGTTGASGTAGQIRFNSIGSAATANTTYSQFLANVAYPDRSSTGAGFIDVASGIVELVPVTPVPEPALLVLLAAAIPVLRRRRRA